MINFFHQEGSQRIDENTNFRLTEGELLSIVQHNSCTTISADLMQNFNFCSPEIRYLDDHGEVSLIRIFSGHFFRHWRNNYLWLKNGVNKSPKRGMTEEGELVNDAVINTINKPCRGKWKWKNWSFLFAKSVAERGVGMLTQDDMLVDTGFALHARDSRHN